jgi:hypothetical protein
MQIIPNWRQIFSSPEEIEKELVGFKFAGPGLYITKSETIILIPINPDKPVTSDTIWNLKQPEGTRWEVNVYYCSPREMFLGFLDTSCGLIPTRQNEGRVKWTKR